MALPRDAVKVMTMRLPKIDKAMMPAITRVAVPFSKTVEKNKTPISRLLASAFDNTQNYVYGLVCPLGMHII